MGFFTFEAIDHRFLEDRRWLIRGRVAVLADVPWALDGLSIARWDEGTPGSVETRGTLGDATALGEAGIDCAIVVILSPTEAMDDVLARFGMALRPGAALLVVAPALSSEQLAEAEPAEPPSEAWLLSVLARVFPLRDLDVKSYGGCIVAGCVRAVADSTLPRLRFSSGPRPGLCHPLASSSLITAWQTCHQTPIGCVPGRITSASTCAIYVNTAR